MTAALQHWNILLPPGASVVEAVADLRATKADFANQIKLLVGYYAAGDAPSRTVWWDAASTAADDGGRVFAVAGVATGRWKSSITDFMDIRLWGAKLDNVTDDYDAFNRAINSALRVSAYGSNMAGTILFPDVGFAYCSQTIHAKSIFTLKGGGTHISVDQSCVIRNPINVSGIYIHSANTQGDTTVAAGSSAAGSVIDGIGFRGAYGGTSGSGIHLRARAILRNINVQGYGGNGININCTAGVGGATEGNANNFSMHDVRSESNVGHGVFVQGADANAGNGYNVHGDNNGGWGIYDNSFLGNTWSGCHTSGNTLGAYKCIGAAAWSVFIGCYSESGQPGSDVRAPAILIGGIHGAGFVAASTAPYLVGRGDNLGVNQGVMSRQVDADGDFLEVAMGGEVEILTILQTSHPDVAVNPFRLRFIGKDIYFDYGAGAQTFRITGPNTTETFGQSAPVPYAFGVGSLMTRMDANGRRVTHFANAPTSGEWGDGDVIHHNAPVAGGIAGWVCTTAGTGGSTAVFKAMAALAA